MNLVDANRIVTLHLREIIIGCEVNNNISHLIKMVDTLLENIETYPSDKTSRWIGFIQGVLYMEGQLDLDEERDFTRPIYHSVYAYNGYEIPDTVRLHD